VNIRHTAALRRRPESSGTSPLIGHHPALEELRRLTDRVARSPTRIVLVYGETGTGKSIVARLLHCLSPRAGREFVDVNCAAIPPSLLESELFGHERGAFTGAVGRKTGLVEAGHRGTVLLDEIREMSLELQAKLLTLLDNQRFRRIGGVTPIEVDTRFVATTNTILLSEVRNGRFREDLYYRLQVAAINIPPLRERGDDVFVLAEHYLRELNARYAGFGRRVTGLEADVRQAFAAYRWPGNVRELQNLLERIFIVETEPRIGLRHLPPRILREVGMGRDLIPRQPWATSAAAEEPTEAMRTDSKAATIEASPEVFPAATAAVASPANVQAATAQPWPADFKTATAAFQRRLIRDALRHSAGRQGKAAASLGLSRHSLRHHMGRLGID
jgi:transcriptional regulator with PAS, ATPase and Fis domain